MLSINKVKDFGKVKESKACKKTWDGINQKGIIKACLMHLACVILHLVMACKFFLANNSLLSLLEVLGLPWVVQWLKFSSSSSW